MLQIKCYSYVKFTVVLVIYVCNVHAFAPAHNPMQFKTSIVGEGEKPRWLGWDETQSVFSSSPQRQRVGSPLTILPIIAQAKVPCCGDKTCMPVAVTQLLMCVCVPASALSLCLSVWQPAPDMSLLSISPRMSHLCRNSPRVSQTQCRNHAFKCGGRFVLKLKVKTGTEESKSYLTVSSASALNVRHHTHMWCIIHFLPH